MVQTFTVENFKGVREITLSPEGSLVVIAGGNGAGKSSFIDAFVELFDPKGTRLTPKPIREGEDEARAEFVDTDLDIRVVRTWKKNDAGRLEVFALDGAKYGKPAEVVAKLTGGLIFDPVAFLNLDEKRQRDALLAKVDLPFDIDEVAREKAGAEQRRLEAGRDVKRLEGALASLPKPAPGTPTEEVSSQAILDKIEAAQAEQRHRERVERDYGDLCGEVHDLEHEIEQLQRRLDDARARKANAYKLREVLPDPVDVAPLREQLAAVEETNAAVRTTREHTRVATELAEMRAAHDAAQADIDAVEAKKAAGLAAATFPVPGLSVDETGVTFGGIPFAQVNTATRLRVAFAIATAGDPDLRLVIVRTGDMLDDTSVEMFRSVADERGYTVLMERDRDSSREIGFTIREGVLDASA